MWLGIALIAMFIVTLVIGFKAGRLSVADECLTRGGFSVGDTDYSCIGIYKKDNPHLGLPDALLGPDNGAFAENTLAKLKFIKPVDRQKLSTMKDGESKKDLFDPFKGYGQPRRELFGEIKDYDCVQCCKDAGDIQRSMILCPKCGNKRCPKAQNHRNACTRSNEPGQVGGVPDCMPVQRRLDGSILKDSYSTDAEIMHDTYSK